jgi:ribosome-binding factor A
MKQDFNRGDRLNRQIVKVLSEVLVKDSNDKRLRMVNITRCEVSSDLAYATIYYVPLLPEMELSQPLTQALGFLRSSLASKLSLRYTPELRFVLDERIAKTRRIEQLLRESAELDKPQVPDTDSESE